MINCKSIIFKCYRPVIIKILDLRNYHAFILISTDNSVILVLSYISKIVKCHITGRITSIYELIGYHHDHSVFRYSNIKGISRIIYLRLIFSNQTSICTIKINPCIISAIQDCRNKTAFGYFCFDNTVRSSYTACFSGFIINLQSCSIFIRNHRMSSVNICHRILHLIGFAPECTHLIRNKGNPVRTVSKDISIHFNIICRNNILLLTCLDYFISMIASLLYVKSHSRYSSSYRHHCNNCLFHYTSFVAGQSALIIICIFLFSSLPGFRFSVSLCLKLFLFMFFYYFLKCICHFSLYLISHFHFVDYQVSVFAIYYSTVF